MTSLWSYFLSLESTNLPPSFPSIAPFPINCHRLCQVSRAQPSCWWAAGHSSASFVLPGRWIGRNETTPQLLGCHGDTVTQWEVWNCWLQNSISCGSECYCSQNWQWMVTICSGSKPEMATSLFLSIKKTKTNADVEDMERSLSGSIFSSIFSCSGSFGDVGGSGAAGFACAACQASQKLLFLNESWLWSPVDKHVEHQNRPWDPMVLSLSLYFSSLYLWLRRWFGRCSWHWLLLANGTLAFSSLRSLQSIAIMHFLKKCTVCIHEIAFQQLRTPSDVMLAGNQIKEENLTMELSNVWPQDTPSS